MATIRRPWVLVSLAWVVPAFFAALQAFAQHQFLDWGGDLWRNVFFSFFDWFFYGALTPIVFALARRVPIARRKLGQRILFHVAASLATCALWALGGTLLRVLIYPGQNALTLESYFGWFIISLPFGVAVYFAVLGIEHAIFYFLQARERETQAARLAAQLAEARLGALRTQMHPHFLLNSLNAVLVLVRDRDHATATRVLEELGEVLRHVLRGGRRPEIPLREEIDFVRRYLAIEQVRFSDRLRTRIEIPAELGGALVPDLLLQPLVENALRHGVARSPEGGTVTIVARREAGQLLLEVGDDGPGVVGAPALREGVGLTNIRERLRVLYGDRATLEVKPNPAGGVVARVTIPYHEAVAPESEAS